MLEYFPKTAATYWANYSVSHATFLGATIGDIDDAVRPYKAFIEANWAVLDQAPDTDADKLFVDIPPHVMEKLEEGNKIWVNGWLSIAERLEKQAADDLKKGRRRSAGGKLLRASALVTGAEWSQRVGEVKSRTFNRMHANFLNGVELTDYPLERLEIPYGEHTLDAMFIPAESKTDALPPVVLFMNGFHSSMDWYVQNGLVEECRKRGVACLLFDHPGSGTARHNKGLALEYQTEKFAKAAIDYLETRDDVDVSRLGLLGTSFGGYYAPRAASLEKRIKACFVWGAMFNWPIEEVFKEGTVDGRISQPIELISIEDFYWFTGKSTKQDLFDYMKKFDLSDVIAQYEGALFILHGENDSQCPLKFHAERTINEAVNASSTELVVIRPEDGGAEHCQLDNINTGRDLLADKIAETL